MIESLKPAFSLLVFAFTLGGCTAAKLEARLEADPQCKPIVNPKTGSLMPCPGTDKGFYESVGLLPARSDIKLSHSEDSTVSDVGSQIKAADSNPVATSSALSKTQLILGCKPQLHKKTGTVLPCPAD
jgi:hypothetical protein